MSEPARCQNCFKSEDVCSNCDFCPACSAESYWEMEGFCSSCLLQVAAWAMEETRRQGKKIRQDGESSTGDIFSLVAKNENLAAEVERLRFENDSLRVVSRTLGKINDRQHAHLKRCADAIGRIITTADSDPLADLLHDLKKSLEGS